MGWTWTLDLTIIRHVELSADHIIQPWSTNLGPQITELKGTITRADAGHFGRSWIKTTNAPAELQASDNRVQGSDQIWPDKYDTTNRTNSSDAKALLAYSAVDFYRLRCAAMTTLAGLSIP